MKKTVLSSTLAAIAFLMIGCVAPAANNTNKPANAPANNANATAPVNAAAIETDVKKLIGDVYAALAKNDVDALDKIYDEKYTLVDIDGSVKTKAERLAELKSGDVKVESVSADEITVRSNAEGTGAVSIARATSKSTRKGERVDAQVRVTTIWGKTKDGWKAAGAHATRITAAEAPKPAANAPANK